MSARNTLTAKAARRRARQVRHVGGCAVCRSKDVIWVDEREPADPSYRAVCALHLGYALATLYGRAR